MPKILKPGIKIKILSDSEKDGKKYFEEVDNYNNVETNEKVNQKINKIKSLRGNNVLISKLKKQIELRKHFEEIYKEVEKRSIEYETKFLGNKNSYIKNGDKLIISKTLINSNEKFSLDKLKITGIVYNHENVKKERKNLLPKIK